MSTSADFTLNDTPQSDGVYRATAGGTVDLKLADGLLIDAGVVKVTLERKTKGATDIPELASEYVLSPASATLTLNIPDEISSWLIRVQLNNGSNPSGAVEPTWTRERVIETVGLTETAKQLAGEMTQRHPARGWSDIQNDMVDALEALAAGGGPTPDPDPFEGLDATSEHRADVVEGGFYVSRLPDQRGACHFIPFERDLALWFALGPSDQNVTPSVPSDYVRLPTYNSRGFDANGDALIRPPDGVGGLWSRSPIVFDLEHFSIALRVRLSASNGQTIIALGNIFPRVGDDCPALLLVWEYTAGATGTLRLTLTDATVTSVDATKTMTHSAWHNVILRFDASNLSIRVDGSNGTPADFSTHDDFHVEHTSLACEIFPDGTVNGWINAGSAIRHILAAPRAWSDAECLTAEAALTAAWT